MGSPAWFARRRSWTDEWTQITGTTASCLVCGGEWSDLHHRSYDRLGNERWCDLIPLCRACHGQLHARLEGNPEWRKRPRPQATDALIAHMRRCHGENVGDDRG
ncbi:MAG: hypothetical protein ACRDYB_05020 [Acidimicrobiales bacterium]